MTIKWQETTVRKGAKRPRICRDMVITGHLGEYSLVVVKNGRMVSCQALSAAEAQTLISDNQLVPKYTAFRNCYTYRTPKSAKIVEELMVALNAALSTYVKQRSKIL